MSADGGHLGWRFGSLDIILKVEFKANMAWMVLKWSIFKIVSSDPDLHPRWPPSAEDLMGKNVLKSSPLKPVSQFKANMAWMLKQFSHGSYIKTMSADSGHFESGSLNTILEVDYLRTIDWFTGFRGDFKTFFPIGSYVKTTV
jgi:hypothetical protein